MKNRNNYSDADELRDEEDRYAKKKYTLKEDIVQAMCTLGRKKKTVFLGENVINSGRLYGTLDRVSTKKCIEMPVAENLIAGAAIGLAIGGFRPVCIFQRMDFILIAADQIINHATLIPKMSGGSVRLPIIFRVVKAHLNKSFWVGWQHGKDFTHIFKPYMPVIEVPKQCNAQEAYAKAYDMETPVLVVEDYKSYGKEVK